MVLKTVKRGIRTGGTIRQHPGAIRRYALRSSDTKAQVTVFRPHGQEKSSLDLPEHFESGLQYSLNKRERWNLPATVFKQVQRLAIEDHKAASDDGKKQKRDSVVLVQHPGMDNFTVFSNDRKVTAKSNYVLYYGERYTIPVERTSHKAKLDPLNIVAQLDEGSFFGGQFERSNKGDNDEKVADEQEKQQKKVKRSRRVIRRVQDASRLVQLTGQRFSPEESNVDTEHIHVYLADEKYINKRRVLKQPTKPVECLPPANQPTPSYQSKVVDSDDYDDYDEDDESVLISEDGDKQEKQQINVSPPPPATFKLADFL